MREIKFRAWDKEKKMMVIDGDTKWMPNAYPVKVSSRGVVYCKKLPSGLDNRVTDEDGNVGYTDWEYDKTQLKGIELMQYTGLKDKNGKEIYEGDIIEAKDISGSGRERNFGAREVRWEKDTCSFNVSGVKIKGATYEVIGNKFENPELLKTNPLEQLAKDQIERLKNEHT